MDNRTTKWKKRLQIINSTTITLFSNLLFNGVGSHLKTAWKKGDIKVPAVIHVNEEVHPDIKFTFKLKKCLKYTILSFDLSDCNNK